MKNGLRALLRAHAIQTPRSLWTRTGIAWLQSTALPTPIATLRRDLLLGELAHAQSMVVRVTAALDKIAGDHPAVALLRTIPGVGPRTAEAFAAYVDDPQRFTRVNRVGNT